MERCTISAVPGKLDPLMTEKKKITLSSAWRDARELIWVHRYRLALGLFLMLVNRLVGLVLPASSKFLIDEVIIKQRGELLLTLALAAGAATLIQAVSSFMLSQVLRRRRATRDHRNAQECAGTYRALAGPLF